MVKDFSILIIDDHKDSAQIIYEYLSMHFKCNYKIVNNPKEAIELVKNVKFDIIFSDIMMPEVDGFEVLNAIQTNKMNAETPVIFISAIDENEFHKVKGFDNGAIDLISKPFTEKELVTLTKLYIRFINREKEINKNLKLEIEERKELEIELKNSRENFKNIVGKSDAGILIIDTDGYVQFMNQRSEEIFQRSKTDVVGKPFGLFNEFKTKSEIEILRNSGELGYGEITTTKTQWKGKSAYLLLINDVTKHVKIKMELTRAIQKAQESDRIKTSFLTNMSHEVRTPLNGIIGFSQLLIDEDELGVDKVVHYAETINKSGNYLLKIINEILDIALLETKQLKIENSVFNLTDSLNDVIGIFERHQKVASGLVSFEFENEIHSDLNIVCDEIRLKQVYINLLNNALKFTDNGYVKTGAKIVNNELLVYVKDSGIGIPPSKENQVFQRFEKTEVINEKLNDGLGLGLAISKEILELLGGRIWFDSKQNVGTEFRFTLPLKEEGPMYLKNEVDVVKDLKLKSRKRILIVEDEDINFFFIKSLLKEKNIEIFWAKNGREAIRIVKTNEIDVILMDMKMPKMDGYEATKIIRRLYPGIPIIAQTAYTLSNDKNKCLEVGCNDYITKPINKVQLINKLYDFLV